MIDPEKTLSDLISLPSVNPMGRSVSGPEYLEARMTAYLEDFFEKLGLPWQRQTVAPERDNIFARLEGPDGGGENAPLILFEAHQDTVQVDGMTIPPFTPEIRAGRIYGRGACDIKGGMSAMLAAFARLSKERPPGMPNIVMACSVNEEYGYTGAAVFEAFWNSENQAIFHGRPDAAIIAEPTNLNVVTAHKGTVRWRCHTRGLAAHSSNPQAGDNALYKMGRVLQAIETYQKNAIPAFPSHPLCGKPSISVGTIAGGRGINTVPDSCTIGIDRRVLPSETAEEAYQHVIRWIEKSPGIDFEIEHDDPFLRGPPLAGNLNATLGLRLQAMAREVKSNCEIVGVPYGTDAAVIGTFGVPCVVFGPGDIEQAHTSDEWLALEELHGASEILYRFGKVGIGTVKRSQSEWR